jgi:hypothetical protein
VAARILTWLITLVHLTATKVRFPGQSAFNSTTISVGNISSKEIAVDDNNGFGPWND